jgi:hypothetical protein
VSFHGVKVSHAEGESLPKTFPTIVRVEGVHLGESEFARLRLLSLLRENVFTAFDEFGEAAFYEHGWVTGIR